jgi:hypothetical protein
MGQIGRSLPRMEGRNMNNALARLIDAFGDQEPTNLLAADIIQIVLNGQ